MYQNIYLKNLDEENYYYDSSNQDFDVPSLNSTYPKNFIHLSDISRMVQLFGFNLNGSTVDQINQIRNRLGFRGIVNRNYFEDYEIVEVLNAFGVDPIGSVSDQKRALNIKIYETHNNPSKPYIPRSNPTASPIVVQLTTSSKINSMIGPDGNFVSMVSKCEGRSPKLNSTNDSKEFSLDDLQTIAKVFGLSTYGDRDVLINNIKTYIRNQIY